MKHFPKRRVGHLPPISEVWKEASVFWTDSYITPYSPLEKQELAGILRDIRLIISLEEVFGPGLLEKMFDQPCIQCGQKKDDVLWRHQNTAYVNDRENYIFACSECFAEIEEYWRERWDEYYSMVR